MFLLKMKLLIVLLVSLVSLCLGQKYTTKYDHLDIEKVLSNQRVLNNYIKCLLDEGPCTAEGREFKRNIPDAINTNCAKCSETQRKIVRKGAMFIQKNRPDDWNRIARKFDPQSRYKESFDSFLRGF